MREKTFTHIELQNIRRQLYEANNGTEPMAMVTLNGQTFIDVVDECLHLREKVDELEYILRLKKYTEWANTKTIEEEQK